MTLPPAGFRQKMLWMRDDFLENMQRVYFRYNIDVPGVITSVASISMICIALTCIFSVRNG